MNKYQICNTYAIFVKIFQIYKQVSIDLVNEAENMSRRRVILQTLLSRGHRFELTFEGLGN